MTVQRCVKSDHRVGNRTRLVARWVEHYNTLRLHSALGYVTPADKLFGLENVIHRGRERKLEAAREERRQRRQAARQPQEPPSRPAAQTNSAACGNPLHDQPDDRFRSFTVNLAKKVFQSFHPPCRAAGNVLDLWTTVHRLVLKDAAQHLAETFHVPLTVNRLESENRNP